MCTFMDLVSSYSFYLRRDPGWCIYICTCTLLRIDSIISLGTWIVCIMWIPMLTNIPTPLKEYYWGCNFTVLPSTFFFKVFVVCAFYTRPYSEKKTMQEWPMVDILHLRVKKFFWKKRMLPKFGNIHFFKIILECLVQYLMHWHGLNVTILAYLISNTVKCLRTFL